MRSTATYLLTKNKQQIKRHNALKHEIIQHTHTQSWNDQTLSIHAYSLTTCSDDKIQHFYTTSPYCSVNSTVRVGIAGIQQADDSSN